VTYFEKARVVYYWNTKHKKIETIQTGGLARLSQTGIYTHDPVNACNGGVRHLEA